MFNKQIVPRTQEELAAQTETASVPMWAHDWKFPSMGLKLIMEFLASSDSSREENENVVLDLSSARQSLVDFICDLNCVYTVSNAISQLVNADEHANGLEADFQPSIDYEKIFNALTRYSEKHSVSRPVNVILIWDLLNYLSRSEIISLMSFLSPYCQPGAKLFAISWLTETIPSQPGNFEMTPQLELIYEATNSGRIESPEYSAQSIVDMMPSFSPYRLSVTRLGMLEVLLQFNELVQAPDPHVITYNLSQSH